MRELKGHATRPKHGRCVAALVSLQHSSMLPGLNRSRIRDEVVLWCCEGVESLGEPEYQVQQHSNLLELPKPLLRVAFSGCSRPASAPAGMNKGTVADTCAGG
eukprot:TRINITY_DN1536_c0_g1_i3.p2 TRINITY_DN1536_c0_g1~~TRINITY_DN1536_c0_g1_i3.p2  ORF type:complete len:103 (-),score=21.24 TRINITY_DN1536_c0_g1_i3:331-639(-)